VIAVDWLEAYREDLREVFAEAERIVRQFPSPLDSMASAYLEKFSVFREDSSKNYICYLLPFWTRAATNLDAAVYRRLSLANVFVMLHFFIQDDLMDSKTPNCRDMLPLSNYMQHEYMNVYRALFPPESLFWHYYQTYLSEWADAVIHENDRDYFTHERGKLAHKASPVKLASTASFLLAGKAEFIPMASQNVDAALVTLQMVDDYADWREDMADGAYNSLVSFAQHEMPEQPMTESLMFKLIYDRNLLDAFARQAIQHHRSLEQLPFKLADIVSFHHSLVESLVSAAQYIEEEKKKLESGSFFYYLSKIENLG
jgi:hypothetical protein